MIYYLLFFKNHNYLNKNSMVEENYKAFDGLKNNLNIQRKMKSNNRTRDSKKKMKVKLASN